MRERSNQYNELKIGNCLFCLGKKIQEIKLKKYHDIISYIGIQFSSIKWNSFPSIMKNWM